MGLQMDETLQKKYEDLVKLLREMENVAVAFSGGVDSVFLLHAAKEALGENVIAITASSATFPVREMRESADFCEKENIPQEVFVFDEMAVQGFSENPANRCYLCKYQLFTKICTIAKQKNAKVVLEGSNADDEKDYRPGMKAVEELGVKSPLRIIGFTKQEIRMLLKSFGIEVWKKASFACLATRIPYGETITKEKLKIIDLGEQFLLEHGFEGVRVRLHGDVARIEVLPKQIASLMADEMREEIAAYFKQIGVAYVSVDLNGYRQGSMNETLPI